MTELIYNVVMIVFQWLMKLGAIFNSKLKLGVDGRAGLLNKLQSDLPGLSKGRLIAWFHAASLGEFEQGRPVIEAFRNSYPDHFILLTFFSPSGYEIRKNYTGADYICYLPADTSHNARRFVEIVKPEIAFFIKYEFWFNYLKELKKNGCRIISFSTIFRPSQIFFQSYGGFHRQMLSFFDHIFIQNVESQQLLNRIGISKFSVAGDTRFDRVKTIAANVKDLPIIAGFVNENACLVAGSVWEADMAVLIPALNELKIPLKVIFAPHEINKEEIEAWRKKLSGKSILYSDLIQKKNTEYHDYLFIDNIGMLSSLYRYGDMAFIGGSFGSGLHNILEAATFGLPIIFGNRGYGKFQEAKDLLANGGATAVAGSDEVSRLLQEWISNSETRLMKGNASKNYVAEKAGATETVMNEVKKILS